MAADVPLASLLALTRALSRRRTLTQTLQTVVDTCVDLLATNRVSLRLLDPTHRRLLATCRAGQALHANATAPFAVGEGLIGWIARESVSLRLDHPEEDPRFALRPDQVEKMGSFLGVPVTVDGECIGVCSTVSPEVGHFTLHHQHLLELVAGICAPHLEVARLERLAQVDTLTGALNRRGLELLTAQSHGPAAFVAIDLDHFKKLNDVHGHAMGDECLRQVSTLLSSQVRASDAVVRLGGEEFLLVLPAADGPHALQIAERARATVEALVLRLDGREARVTLSAGVAVQAPGEPREDALARADQALYRSKGAGRNRVTLAPPPEHS